MINRVKERIDFIDALRGLAIIFVIWGHSYVSERVHMYIFSFHMPLFFFISGLLFKENNNDTEVSFIRKKFKKLIIPYLVYSIISILIVILIDSSNINNIPRYIEEIILARRNHHSFNISLWFLPALFLVEVMYYLLDKYIKNNSIISLVLLISSYIGIIKLGALESVNTLPLSMDVGIVYILFYHIGRLFKNIDYDTIIYKFISIICVILSVIICLNRAFFEQFIIPILGGPYFSITLYYRSIAITLISIVAYLFVAKLIKNNSIIKKIGKNSMTLFALHMPLTLPIARRIFENINIIFKVTSLNGVIITFITIVITIPIVVGINFVKNTLNNKIARYKD